jgi:hypothetical protein
LTDIFREIDEELRRDNFAKLWARYGTYVIALAVAIVVVVAAIVFWRQHQEHQRAAEGQRLVSALDLAQRGDAKGSGEILNALAEEEPTMRAVLARFEEADLAGRSGDTTGAAAAYEAIAGETSLDPAYRDLATILAAQYGLAAGSPQILIERLNGLASGDGPWRPSALELTALAQLKAGDKNAARGTYQRLADDLAAPQGLRGRAAEMASALAP